MPPPDRAVDSRQQPTRRSGQDSSPAVDVHSPLPAAPTRLRLAMAVVGVLAFLVAAAGIAVPATHGTRTTADEPQ